MDSISSIFFFSDVEFASSASTLVLFFVQRLYLDVWLQQAGDIWQGWMGRCWFMSAHGLQFVRREGIYLVVVCGGKRFSLMLELRG